jgi:multidrug efflux pump subunit AcrA (membrane-fusion protein)
MKFAKNLVHSFKVAFNNVLRFLSRFAFATFIIFLIILFGVIVAGNTLRKAPPVPEEPVKNPVPVSVFKQDEQPMLDLTARVEKAGVITIVAQAPGIVQKIHVTEGKEVKDGGRIVSLSTNYQGGNAQTVSRQLADRNRQFNQETYDIQKDLINRQKELARKGETVEREIREIGRKSIDDTKVTVGANEDLLKAIEAQIKELEDTNVGGANDALILTAKQGRAGVLAALTNLRAGLRSTEYQTSDDKTPAKIGEEARDLTLKQLELQEKSLDLSRDVAALNSKLARVMEQTMFPAAPCGGVIERIYVKSGQSVNPGTPIATLRTDHTQANAIIAVPGEIARQVNRMEPSKVMVNGKEVSLFPRYISNEATEGSLYAIHYTLPDEFGKLVTQGTTLTVKVPVGGKKLTSNEVIAPIDAIYQTPDKAYLYVMKTATSSAEAGQSGQVAELREVELGQVTGEYVQVHKGIEPSDPIITSRGVTEGQKVTVK